MDIYSNREKYKCIYNWKKYGLIYDDYDDLFEVYRKTLVCQHCNKEFKNKLDRHMDHCHETGLFRKIVCRSCNNYNYYINYPNGRDFVQYTKDYYRKNIEKIYKQKNEKIKCICGSNVSKSGIAQHRKTPKHMKNMEVYMENVD